ncbi:hypothetical protein SAMN05428988_4383 [Chitinophaga sp. YR573]|uniref:hypothetical protein n=1 Tax=Chitinophaga sp. YR573 TaxID=1881040 RepID=UPI0008AFA8E7|nr:hypothetical protein [Chitinophaga sp. YR573]SEW35741.1 hypothetical protein SAMN05428988_4383 [Chitinophaga sp. YR573]
MKITETFTGVYAVEANFKFNNTPKGNSVTTILTKRILFLKVESAADMVAKLNLIFDSISTSYFSVSINVSKGEFMLGNSKAQEKQVYGEEADNYIELLKDEREEEILSLLEEDFILDEYLNKIYWNDKYFNDIRSFSDILNRIIVNLNNNYSNIPAYNKSFLSTFINKDNQTIKRLMIEVFDYYYWEILSRNSFTLVKMKEIERNIQFPIYPWIESTSRRTT